MSFSSIKERVKSFEQGEWKWVTLSILLVISVLGLIAAGVNGIISVVF